MLACHEEGNHHVCDFVVGDLFAVFVGAVHKVPNHVLFFVGVEGFAVLFRVFDLRPAFFDNGHVGFGHFTLSHVSAAVLREGCPGKHKVDWGETHVEVVVEICEACVEFLTYFTTLERTGGSVDCEFGHCGGEIEGTGVGSEAFVGGVWGEKCLDFLRDEGDVGAEG